jgi:hypothetical protein
MAATTPSRSHLDPDKEIQKPGASGSESGAHATNDLRNADGSSIVGSDILGLEDLDPALNLKMHLVNDVSCFLLPAAPPTQALLDRQRRPLRVRRRGPRLALLASVLAPWCWHGSFCLE